MSRPLIIENARIVDPASNHDATGAILIENGVIKDMTNGPTPGAPDGAERCNAAGQVLAPGLIDMRVFTGEPGHEYRETLESASNAAAAGGVTSFVTMPDTQPTIDDSALIDFIIRRAEATASVRVLPAAAITRGLKGTEITEFGLLKEAGAACLTDGRRSLGSTALLRAALTYAANFDMVLVNHLDDEGLSGSGVMNEGLMATGLGLPGIPNEAETVPLERDLQLAALTGARYHAAQLSSAASVTILARHKAHNKSVSGGVSINNLALNEIDIGSYRTFFKLSPPLRAEADRQALIDGLRNGTIDTIHSGHDPQDVETKRHPFAEAADGATGLETLLAASLRLVHSGDIDLLTVLRAMTARPAEILNLASGRLAKGAPADMILINLDYPWVHDEKNILSRSRNTTFEGARFTGKVMRTYVAGRLVHHFEESDA